MQNFKSPYPSLELWSYRKEYFSYLMGLAVGDDYIGVSTNHARVLELELETLFCSGAWYATIVFACAAVESYVSGQGEKSEAKYLKKYDLRDDWIWLTNKRKYIIHPSQHSPSDPISMLYEQPELEEEARRAVGIALKVLLLGTREKLPSSLERNG